MMTENVLNFDYLFNQSGLSQMLSKAKTLSKEECRLLFEYVSRKKPRTILEFGTQYGCSTKVFLEIAKWLGIPLILHSWDIIDVVKEVSKRDFIFHLENVTGRELPIIEEYQPDFVFLDGISFELAKNMMNICLSKKIDFMLHSITRALYERVRIASNNFTFFDMYVPWESYLLVKLAGLDMLDKDFFENSEFKITCRKELYGVCIVEMKNH